MPTIPLNGHRDWVRSELWAVPGECCNPGSFDRTAGAGAGAGSPGGIQTVALARATHHREVASATLAEALGLVNGFSSW